MSSRRLLLSGIAVALFGSAVLSGCSSFKGSRRMDMAPFSENTGVMFAEAAKVSRPFQFKNLRPYVALPEFQENRERSEPLLKALRSVVFYSNQVVAIANSKLSAQDKNRQLARYLREVLDASAGTAFLDSLGLDEASAKTVLQNIRDAKTYLEGIAAAGPIVTAVVVAVQDRLDDLQQTVIPAIEAGMDRAIEVDFRDTRTNYMNLKGTQARSMRALNLLYVSRMGDRSALDTLLNEDPSVKDFLPSAQKASAKELAAAERYLIDRLAGIDIVIHQLDYDLAAYKAKQDELGAWRIDVDERVKIARNAMAVWAQSHRNLGAGIPVPPLIDVQGITGSLVGSAKNAVF
jgi:hypothetical protein